MSLETGSEAVSLFVPQIKKREAVLLSPYRVVPRWPNVRDVLTETRLCIEVLLRL